MIYRTAVALWMNVLIGLVAVATVTLAYVLPQDGFPDQEVWAVGALKLFALWCLSFVPGWLYVRFLGLRAGVLWAEYVLNLHRMGWDAKENLPAPPPGSVSRSDLSSGTSSESNVYRQKFDAYYGRRVSSSSTNPSDTQNFTVSVETLFPIFLCTTVLAVGWATVLWETDIVLSPSGPWDALKFGFLGAYAFAVTMLVRRFYQSDLRPSAYAGVVLRIVLVLLIVAVLHQFFALDSTGGATLSNTEMITAFVVGFFPLVGLQALQRVASKALRVVVPQLSPEYPLDQLDGLNVWYEARLTEEGVEDMQNLTTMNLVDVILHTRVPVGRLVDWVDQAFLLIHLEPVDRKQLAAERQAGSLTGADPRSGVRTRIALRRVGIRTATDLLKAMPEPDDPRPAIRNLGLEVDQLRVLATVLKNEEGLTPVWNWRCNGVPRSTDRGGR
ncbi:hypothetical protein [Nocardioides sp. SR21]|uniref:hypothetical protein n=1 Tax=Nocardioides sp. SR21 TaxID=2919501 RepID=UPI001FAAAF08|nr:hypothetical protein [Nocardioides sp. SR21]